MKVEILRHIYSDSPAAVGIWCLQAERDLPAAPREGDFIELAPGWSSALVKHCTFMADGTVHVELAHVRTDNPDSLIEEHLLVDEHDWMWVGKAPARNGRGAS